MDLGGSMPIGVVVSLEPAREKAHKAGGYAIHSFWDSTSDAMGRGVKAHKSDGIHQTDKAYNTVGSRWMLSPSMTRREGDQTLDSSRPAVTAWAARREAMHRQEMAPQS